MDSKTFFDNFETIANAPGGITRLRELILDLAVRGKLVPRNAADGDTSTLLTQCAEFEAMLVSDGLINQPRFQRGQAVAEIPYPIPSSWSWVRLGDVSAVVGGGTPSTTNATFWARGEDVPWITPADMRSQVDRYVSRGSRDITKLGLETSSAQLLPTGSVLFSSRAPIGHVGIAANPLATNQGFKSCVPYLTEMSEFIYLFLRKAGKEIDAMATGTTFREVSGKQVAQVLIPVPPIPEQKRIVAKVDELMALCDELEASQDQRNSIRTAARKSAIDAISTATTSEELDVAWKRISNNWMTLADTPESIASLRSLIHDVALSGVFGGADTWREVPLGEISRINYGYTESANQKQVGPKFLRITDIQNGMVNWDEVPFCVISAEDEKKQKLESGDIVFARTGATTGKSHLLIDPPRSVCASYLIRLRPSKEKILPEYLYLYFQSGRYWLSVKAGMSGTAQGGFNSTKLGNMSVLLPALDEQQRIIAKVSELIALCDELDKSLLERNVLALKMAGAFVANLAA